MLVLAVAEAALEFVPASLWADPAVAKHARRVGLPPGHLFLDRSYHHAAMRHLHQAEKRGRPDLVHVTLLSATDTPLFELGGLRVYVHTCTNRIIEISPGVRLPRSYFRFEGLMRQVLGPHQRDTAAPALLHASSGDVRSIVTATAPQLVLGLASVGKPSSPEDVGKRLVAHTRSMVIVGGFPHGHFSQPTRKACDQLLAIHAQGLEAHVVVARVLYEVERSLAVLDKRGSDKPSLDVA